MAIGVVDRALAVRTLITRTAWSAMLVCAAVALNAAPANATPDHHHVAVAVSVQRQDPCHAHDATLQQIDRQISDFNTQFRALNQRIAAHNARPHSFRLPEQAAQYNAYNAEANALNAQKAMFRTQAQQLNSARAKATRGLQTCREQVRAQAEAQRQAQAEAEDRFATALDCVLGGFEELAGTGDPPPGEGERDEDLGLLQSALDCMDGVREILEWLSN